MNIRSVTDKDLDAVVEIHQAAFPGFFMTRLGPSFLKHYYRTVLDFPWGLFLVAQEDGRTIGFVAGFGTPERFYKQLNENRFRLASTFLVRAIQEPSLVLRILASFRHSKKLEAAHEAGAYELASVAVHPGHGGKGIGRSLVSSFIELAKCTPESRLVYLTTDALDNEPANNLYKRCGFHLARTFEKTKGRVMNEYQFVFDGRNE